MHEYIYKHNEKYYRELTDLTGRIFFKEEITECEYTEYKAQYRA